MYFNQANKTPQHARKAMQQQNTSIYSKNSNAPCGNRSNSGVALFFRLEYHFP
jgi:hypothetical protein